MVVQRGGGHGNAIKCPPAPHHSGVDAPRNALQQLQLPATPTPFPVLPTKREILGFDFLAEEEIYLLDLQ